MEDKRPDEEKLLDDPSGGPSVKGTSGGQDDDVDASAGAGGQDDGDEQSEGAVEEASEDTGDSKPSPD